MISKVKIYVNGKRKFNWFGMRWSINDSSIVILSDSFKRYCIGKQITFDYMYTPPVGLSEFNSQEYIFEG